MAKIISFCKNGALKVGYERRKDLKTCSFGMFVGAGSRNERPEENGIAHFIEHMLFKGTEKRTAYDIASEADSLGANMNAYTSKTNTVFYVSGLNKNIEKFMDILSDMLFHSTFREEDIERERGVVLEEIKMYEDDGESVCADLLAEKYFEGDTLARPILGTEETVKSFNEGMIRAFMKREYTPENIFLVYVGPSPEEEISGYIKTYFEEGMDKRKYDDSDRVKVGLPKTHAVYAERTDKPFEQANIIIRFPAFSVDDAKNEFVGAVTSALGGGMSSRLFQKVREEQGLVYEIYASASAVKGTGFVDIGFATAPALVPTAIAAIREVLAEVKKDGFTQSEYEKARIQRETAVVYSEEGTFDEMRVIGRYYFLLGKIVTVAGLYKVFEKMTIQDMNGAFAEIFDYEKAALCYVGKPVKDDLYKLLKNGGDEQ